MNIKPATLIVLLVLCIATIGGTLVLGQYYAASAPDRAFDSANSALKNINSLDVQSDENYLMVASVSGASKSQTVTSKNIVKIDVANDRYSSDTTSATDNSSNVQVIYASDIMYVKIPDSAWTIVDKNDAVTNNIPQDLFNTKTKLSKLNIFAFADDSSHKFLQEENFNNKKVYSYSITLSEKDTQQRKDSLIKTYFDALSDIPQEQINISNMTYTAKVYEDSNTFAQQTLTYDLEILVGQGKLNIKNGQVIQTFNSIGKPVDIQVPQGAL